MRRSSTRAGVALLALLFVGACSGRGSFSGIFYVAASGPASATLCVTYVQNHGNLYEPGGQWPVEYGFPVDSQGVIGPETACVGSYNATWSPIALDGGGALRFVDAAVTRDDANGQPLWTTTLPFVAKSGTVTSEGHVFFTGDRDKIGHFLLSDGAVTWVRVFTP